MFETSKDILYIILAFCILWLTIFLSWLLFYIISILRNLRWFIKGAKENMENVVKGIGVLREKIEHSFSHLGFIADAAKHLLSYFLDSKMAKKKKKK